MLAIWTPSKTFRASTCMQGLDKGILFCTYSLLISQSTSKKTIQDQQRANPWLLKDPKITDVHASRDHAEAAWGKLEFGANLFWHVALSGRRHEAAAQTDIQPSDIL